MDVRLPGGSGEAKTMFASTGKGKKGVREQIKHFGPLMKPEGFDSWTSGKDGGIWRDKKKL